MKVWIITMAFPYPSETFACNDVLALKKLGVTVAVHGLRPQHRLFSQLVTERGLQDVWITHNSIRSTIKGLQLALKQPLLWLKLLGWMIRHTWRRPLNLIKSAVLLPRSLHLLNLACQDPPDVVHLYWSHFPALVGHLIQHKLPQVITSISFVAHDVHYPEFDAKESYTGSVARQADLVQTITAANIPAIEKYGIPRNEIMLAYHGVDFSKIPVIQSKISRRIVTAGRLIFEKGFENVLKTFSQVLQLWPDASLTILGDGPERDRLEALACSLQIRHAVDFRGFVSHEAIFAEMAIAEVFLFLSFYTAERLPNVVKEAMACRCLCVVSHTPGIEELIDPAFGFVVQPSEIDRATQAIHWAFVNPQRRVEMTQIAYQHLKQQFDLEQTSQKMQRNWQNLLKAKAADSVRV